MPKKVGITLPDSVYRQLEVIANKQGRPPTTLAAFLIEYCLAGQLGIAGNVESIEEETDISASSKFLKALAQKTSLTNEELVRLAHQLNISAEILESIRDCYMRETENANNA